MNIPALESSVPVGESVEFWGPRQAGYSVAANSKNIDAAVQMAEYSATCDALNYGRDQKSTIVFDIGEKYDISPLAQVAKDRVDNAKYKFPCLTDWIFSAKSSSEYYVLMNQMMTGTLSGADFAKQFNEIWKDNYGDIVE
jgi:hypothetical protein